MNESHRHRWLMRCDYRPYRRSCGISIAEIAKRNGPLLHCVSSQVDTSRERDIKDIIRLTLGEWDIVSWWE